MEFSLKKSTASNTISWDFFPQEFQTKYVTDDHKETKWKQFLNMKQGNLIVAEYEKEFSRLSKYAPEPVLTETFRCRQFEDGLKESIKRYLTSITSLKVENFYQLVQVAMKIEKSKMKNQERNRESSLEVVPLQVKGLKILKWNQYMVLLLQVGDKDLQ